MGNRNVRSKGPDILLETRFPYYMMDGTIFIHDITSSDSLHELLQLMKFGEVEGDYRVEKLILGNKRDLEDNRAIDTRTL